jgi:MFS transporter, FSR family, fosmidomycin resistance protein
LAQILAAEDRSAETTAFAVIGSLAFCHLLNDMMQSLLPALYPTLKAQYGLSFTQIGLVTLTYQLTASLLQPAVGIATDRRARPYSLAVGMGFTFFGLIALSVADHFAWLLGAAAMVGIGSAVFHPEASRVARLASGGRHGFAQSLFQMGGSLGASLGPLLAAFVVVARGQGAIAWFSLVALLGMVVLWNVGRWYRSRMTGRARTRRSATGTTALPRGKVVLAMAILLVLIFSKFFYLASLTSYYTFYLISTFGVSVPSAQVHLFVFLGAAALGTFIGGPVGDRWGRKRVIWGSILGVVPFTLGLPHADLVWTAILSVPIGMILASAFPAIVVYGQELMPGNVGMVAGLFFGLAFGMAGVGAAALGALADATSIGFVYRVCAFLPLLGLFAAFLPDLDRPAAARPQSKKAAA